MSKKAMYVAMMARVPVIDWGPPGVGKTAQFVSWTKALGWHIETVIASIREPSDFSGLPVQNDNGSVTFAPPSWAERLVTKTEQGINCVLFLDEISTAPPAVQAALLRVVLDRYVGDLRLPDSVAIVAAANPPEEAANGWELSPPLANRFCHFTWSNSLDNWCDGMLSGWPIYQAESLPKGWDSPINIQTARSSVVSFIRTAPNLANAMPKNEAERGKAWPSYRTWDMVARLLAAGRAYGLGDDSDEIFKLAAGCVGSGAAIQFKKFLEGDELPNFEELLSDPKKLKLPKRGDRVWAILDGVTATVVATNMDEKFKDKDKVTRWNQGWEVLSQAAHLGAADVAANCARLLVKNRPSPTTLPPPAAMKFKEVLVGAGLW